MKSGEMTSNLWKATHGKLCEEASFPSAISCKRYKKITAQKM